MHLYSIENHCLKNDRHVDDERQKKSRFFWLVNDSEGGYTSIGVVIALSLVITLVYTSSQIYWYNSRAGDIQFAADAGVLAAENIVAEFYVVARVTDAVLLSLTLFGVTVLGVSIIVSLIPYCQEAGIKLMEFAKKVFEARDRIADNAIPALTKLQKILPFVAIANAAVTVQANAPIGSTYIGLALLIPFTADDVGIEDDGDFDSKSNEIDSSNRKAQDEIQKAEEADQDSKEAYRKGWLADCGATADSKSMYERAHNLANLTNNTRYELADWNFSYALARAKNYYSNRLANDTPASMTPDDITRSVMRRLYYRYALDLLDSAYVFDDGLGNVSMYFPDLPRNSNDFRSTSIYRNAQFPLDGSNIIHGHNQCPVYLENGGAGTDTIRSLDLELHSACTTCNMTWLAVSNVFSPTTNNQSGFEYWYSELVKAAKQYESASQALKTANEEGQRHAQESIDEYDKAISMVKAKRVDLHPPGRKGCIIFVIAPQSLELPTGLRTPLVSQGASQALPPRMAISAAALAKDCVEDANILASLLDCLKSNSESAIGQTVLGGFDFVLEVWSYALMFYEKGVDALTNGLRQAVASSSSSTLTWLADWAADAIEGSLKKLGMTPVDLRSPKPLLVNSYHVAMQAGDSSLGRTIVNAKNIYAAVPGNGSGTLTDMLFDGIVIEIETFGYNLTNDGLTITVIRFGEPIFPVEIPVTVQMPESIVSYGVEYVRNTLRDIQDHLGGEGHVDIWE
ncbi:MAG: hypothetical protein FWH40_02225 [Coriobacteriia bacterium]|nr:hypothetical protein [Coriobacteriia bacterium]